METRTPFEESALALLHRRRTQRGFPTLGDDADHALVLALARMDGSAATLARQSGERLGEQVYSRVYHDGTLPLGVELLSTDMHTSGIGTLALDETFHRTARVRYHPSPDLAGADEAVRSAFVAGILSGCFSKAFNCIASASRAGPDLVEVTLGEGHDVNHRGGGVG